MEASIQILYGMQNRVSIVHIGPAVALITKWANEKHAYKSLGNQTFRVTGDNSKNGTDTHAIL